MLEPDASHPMAGQIWPPTKACLRHRGTREWFYHPDRVNFPLQRSGERGEAMLAGFEGPFTTACRLPEAEQVMRMIYRNCEVLDSLLD